MQLRGHIRQIATEHPADDAKTLARRLIAKLRKVDWVEILAEEIAHEQRGIARDTETTALAAFFATPLTQRSQIDTSRLKAVFDTPIRLGDGFMTSWGAATVEQHRQRIAMLEKLRDGLSATISRHEEAIGLIERARVSCLNDLESSHEAAA